MHKYIHKTLAFLMAAAFVSVMALPSFATGQYVSRDTFWNWAASKNGLVQKITAYAPGDAVCAKSSDGYHHATSYVKASQGGYYACICTDCGEDFTAYASDLEQSYTAQVSEMPVTSYGSDGSLLYSPKHSYMCACLSNNYGSAYYGCEHYTGNNELENRTFEFDCISNAIAVYPASGNAIFQLSHIYFYYAGVAPIDGTYTLMITPVAQGSWQLKNGDTESSNDTYREVASKFYSAGTSFSVEGKERIPNSGTVTTFKSVILQGLAPIYKIEPAETFDKTTYNINSRPTSITGDYGIIGDNGQITKVEGDTIVNETNNTYYNPATGKTDTITDWSYDYNNRTYTLTLGGGTTSTVTYGDENVTIKEGDTIYNVYYLVENTGTDIPTPGPEACNHTWTETSITPATCTVPGSRLLTCSLCNQTKTEPIPALGHKWEIKQTVATQYDETGQLTQQGYTIFECSVCHEQYKSEDGTAPPGSADQPEDTSGFLDSLAQTVTDTLESVLKTVFSIFDTVPSLFDGFLAFLSAMFPFLPPEIITLLTFGIAAVVLIGIIKAFRR